MPILEIYPVTEWMSKAPLIDFKKAMFQHSNDGFICRKEEVDHSKLHQILMSKENYSLA